MDHILKNSDIMNFSVFVQNFEGLLNYKLTASNQMYFHLN